MARPFIRAQALQNQAFLAELRRTGNARDAARTLGVHRTTFTKRRARDPGFAAAWNAALAIAHANLLPPSAAREGPGEGVSHPPKPARPSDAEPHIVRTARGRLQLRRATPARLTRAHEQAFLAALSATANVRLSAAAAGFSHSAFYARRKTSPGFAREMRLALEMGYDQLEQALLASADPASHDHDAWRHNDPPPIPQMTANQALQLMYLHQKEARLGGTPDALRRRKGESSDARSMRLQLMYEARQQRARDAFIIAETERRARGQPSGFGPAILPDLSQVTGWSKADPSKPPHHEGLALFGGWRLRDVKVP